MERFKLTAIIDKIERFVIPPALLEDEDCEHVVRPLAVLSGITFVVAVIYAILWIFVLPGLAQPIVVSLTIAILAVLSLFLIRLGKVWLARHVLLGGLWMFITLTILTAGGSQDDTIGGYFLGDLGEVIASGFGSVAASDEEEMPDLAGFHCGDNLIGQSQHGGMMESGAQGWPGHIG